MPKLSFSFGPSLRLTRIRKRDSSTASLKLRQFWKWLRNKANVAESTRRSYRVSLQGKDDESVLRNTEDRSFRYFDADHAIRQTANVISWPIALPAGNSLLPRRRRCMRRARRLRFSGSAMKRPSATSRFSMSTQLAVAPETKTSSSTSSPRLTSEPECRARARRSCRSAWRALSGIRSRPSSALCCVAERRRWCQCL
jgi:hypothetical protein